MPSRRPSPPSEDFFSTADDAIASIREGRFVIVVGVPERRSECALTIAAEHCSTEAVSFMLSEGRGMIYLSLTPEQTAELGLQSVPTTNANDAAFMVPIDAREGVSTGISAADRSHTIRTAIVSGRGSSAIVSPGHVYPIRARGGGVLERQAHTEAAVDLASLAGLAPAGVLCGILTAQGDMAQPADLADFCRVHGIRMVRIQDLVDYRRRHEVLVERHATVSIPTPTSKLTAVAFRETVEPVTHLALLRGPLPPRADVPVTIHIACPLGNALGSLACDCRSRLDAALDALSRTDAGVLLYLGCERSTNLAWHLEQPEETKPEDDYEAIVQQILENLRDADADELATVIPS